MAGAFTESTVIGTAGETINRLAMPDREKAGLLANIPVAQAVSYLVGAGFIDRVQRRGVPRRGTPWLMLVAR